MTYVQETKGQPPTMQAATANPTPVRLEHNRRAPTGRERAQTVARVLEAVDRSAAKAIVSALAIGRAIGAIIGKSIHAAFRGEYRPIVRSPPVSRPAASAIRKSPAAGKTHLLGRLAVSACLGLTAFCAIMVLVLLLQMRDSTAKIDRLERELAITRAQLSQLEKKVDVPQPVPKEANAAKSQPPHMPLSLATPEIKLIRESIKVLPPNPEAKGTIHLGDDVSALTLVPVPDSLVEQLPKLRGARFSIDQDGTIIIVGPSSDQADAVIGYR